MASSSSHSRRLERPTVVRSKVITTNAAASKGTVNMMMTHCSPSTSSLSRSIDKMFEEAELSGILILASRKLKEIPTQLASKYDISDTVVVDASNNRLSNMPSCLCELTYLETLKLAGNSIRSLPVTVQLLESLTFIDLSGNQLTVLPSALCHLPLQILIVARNRLESIPRDIRQMADTLSEFDVSCNRLTYLPPDVGLLKCLRVLNVRQNQLTNLPLELCRLHLRILDLSSNNIAQLPIDLRLMTSLIDLKLDWNPLICPPANICEKGRGHVFKWLRVHANNDDETNRSRRQEWSTSQKMTTVNSNGGSGTLDRNTVARQMYIYLYLFICYYKFRSVTDDFKNDLKPEKRFDRRPRYCRFNTIGGDVSSTVDEQLHRPLPEISNKDTISHRTPPVGEESPVSTNVPSSSDHRLYRPRQPPPPTPTADHQHISNGLVDEVMNACRLTNGTNNHVTPERRPIRLASPEPDGSPTPLALQKTSAISPTTNRGVNRMLELPIARRTTGCSMSSDRIQSIYTGGKSGSRNGITMDVECLSPVIESPASNTNAVTMETIQSSIAINKDAIQSVASTTITIDSANSTTTQSAIINSPTTTSAVQNPPLKQSTKTSTSNGNILKHTGSLSSSQSSLASLKGTTNRRPSAPKILPLGTVAPTTTASKSSKLGKPRDSIGITRNNQHRSDGSRNNVTLLSSETTIANMRKLLEQRLNIDFTTIIDDDRLAEQLADGVHLCNYLNSIRIRSVPTVLAPINCDTPLSSAKCRRNIDNFIAACRRLGIAESQLSTTADIVDRKNLNQLAKTIVALSKLPSIGQRSNGVDKSLMITNCKTTTKISRV